MSQLEFKSLNGRRVPVELRRRKGIRHMRLSLNLKNSIVLSLPWHCSLRAGQTFIEQNREWLERQIMNAPDAVSLKQWLEHSPWLTAAGQRFRVSVEYFPVSRSSYLLNREDVRVILRLPSATDEEAPAKLVLGFAGDVLRERANELAARAGLVFTKLSVRNQSSRWGSCSSKRTISLNWRLVLLEPVLQDYVIFHELAHLRELNHSNRFWELLERFDPERRQHEAALQAITPELMRVRV